MKNENKLFSKNKSTLLDNNDNFYNLESFQYFINKKILKGENIILISNYKKPKSDKIFFSNAFFNFENNEFLGKDTQINLHRKLFDNERIVKKNTKDLEKRKINSFKGKNQPRIYGSSASGNQSKTIINKGIFTTCKKNDNCPPWSMSAKKITHDKIEKI